MNTKNKKVQNRKLPLLLIAIGIALVVVLVAGLMLRDKRETESHSIKINHHNNPEFVFDADSLPNWKSTGSSWHDGTTDPDASREERVATVAWSAFQCESASDCNEIDQSDLNYEDCQTDKKQQCDKLQRSIDAGLCMVHAYMYEYPLNPDKAIADHRQSSKAFGLENNEIAIKTLTMTTPEGNKTYQLYQYDNSKNVGYKSGVSMGYVPLKNSHIEIQGICNDVSQLDEVLPVLSSLRLSA